ncbi:hypothetical protein NDU88_001967 [Pleurodeles waltl]|uniref:Uncharacterized protein n=1 Tax=Pleurodeles waltl TaxID=8319 RepID=A0AAV7REH4_PLEWA|nr:hypothetical protein NDU88_001967 [Pleurodeles waltl]
MGASAPVEQSFSVQGLPITAGTPVVAPALAIVPPSTVAFTPLGSPFVTISIVKEWWTYKVRKKKKDKTGEKEEKARKRGSQVPCRHPRKRTDPGVIFHASSLAKPIAAHAPRKATFLLEQGGMKRAAGKCQTYQGTTVGVDRRQTSGGYQTLLEIIRPCTTRGEYRQRTSDRSSSYPPREVADLCLLPGPQGAIRTNHGNIRQVKEREKEKQFVPRSMRFNF